MTRGAWRVAAAGLLTAMAAPAAGQPPAADAVVAVRRAGEAGGGVLLLGFVADAAGHVVAQIVADDADGIVGADFVVRLADGAEHAARGVAYDAASGLGLLRVTADPPPAPYPFARDPAEPGRTIYGATLDADTGGPVTGRGSISRIESAASDDPATIRHNALAGRRKHGAPLFNNCGQVVGVIVERAATSPGVALAAPAEWLVTTFGGAGLAPEPVADGCLPDAERALAAERDQREAERRAAEADAARAEAEAARAEAEKTAEAERERAADEEARREEAEEEAGQERAAAAEAAAKAERERAAVDDARRAAEQALLDAEQNQAAQARKRAEAQEQAETEQARTAAAEQERQAAQQYVVWAVAAGGALSVLLAGLWLAARRSRARATQAGRAAAADAAAARAAMAARAEAEREAAAVPDVVLTGTDPAGQAVSLRVPGRAVADSSGAVVGRSPFDGEVVLNHPEVSRRHFRLFRTDGALMVEDLGSMNGTALDGDPLVVGDGRPLGAGARLRVGRIEFTVRTPAGDGAGEGAQ